MQPFSVHISRVKTKALSEDLCMCIVNSNKDWKGYTANSKLSSAYCHDTELNKEVQKIPHCGKCQKAWLEAQTIPASSLNIVS